MGNRSGSGFLAACLAWLAVLGVAAGVAAAEPRKRSSSRTNEARPAADAPAETVALFDALGQNKLAAQVTTFDHTTVRVVLANRTNQPLSVEIPAGLGAVPLIVAQRMQQQATVPGLLPTAPNAETPQTLGLWPPQSPGNSTPLRPAQAQRPAAPAFPPIGRDALAARENLFNVAAAAPPPTAVSIAPQQMAPLVLRGVCLQYGNPTPRPRDAFVLRPLEQTPTRPEVRALLPIVAREDLPQRVAQAAAWHLANGLSWERMLDRSGSGAQRTRFTLAELQAAQQLVERVRTNATSAGGSGGGGGSGETPRR